MNAQTTTPQPGDTIYAEWAVGPAQRGSGWVDVRQAKNLTAYTVGEPLGLTMTVVLPSGGHITIREGDYLTEADMRAAEEAIWNADPTVEDRFEEVYADETNDCTGAARAAEVARSRELNGATPHGLAADYAKHGNAWPFSGDHLNTVDIREEVYTPGVGWESGDVIGRARR